MAKAEPLTPAHLAAPQIVPRAATPARSPRIEVTPPPALKPDQVPLQVRIPREEAKAIKVAAAEAEQTISEFMLACFHAYMQGKGRG